MNNLLKSFCIAFSMFYFRGVLSRPTVKGKFDELLSEIERLKNHTYSEECKFVPVIGEIKDSSFEDVSCRAVKILKLLEKPACPAPGNSLSKAIRI